MDSGNSGSISSSGDEEYDSRSEPIPATFLNPPNHLSFLSHPSLFDLSPGYFHSLSQSQPTSQPINSLLNSEAARSEPDYADPANLPPGSSSSLSALAATDQSNLLRSVHENNTRPSATATANVVVRPSKKRTRASRRAPTTVLTTNTSNFRAMVQEFTGIPATPFPGGSSYSRRLDLLAGSSSFYPQRPSAHKVQPNPLLMATSSLPWSSASPTLLQSNTVDAIASTTHNISQLPPFDLGLPYNQSQNISMLSMQIPPVLTFQHPPLPFQPLGNTLSGFSAKPQESLSMASLEDLGMSRVSVPAIHGHEGRNPEGRREELRSLDGSYGKVGGS